MVGSKDMLDIARLRTSVATGSYVVDPHAVADALLSRAGVTGPPAPDGQDESPPLNPAGARSPSEAAARRPRG